MGAKEIGIIKGPGIIDAVVGTIGAGLGTLLSGDSSKEEIEKARKEGFKDGYQKASSDYIDKLSKYIAENQR